MENMIGLLGMAAGTIAFCMALTIMLLEVDYLNLIQNAESAAHLFKIVL